MLVAAFLTLSLTMNVITATAIYRVWLWAQISASIGHPFAIFANTRALQSAWDVVRAKR